MTTITTPAVPTKTDDMSWDEFAAALAFASASYQDILVMRMPTPEIEAKPGTP